LLRRVENLGRQFLRPRSRIEWIIHHDPNYGVMMVAMFCGIAAAIRSSVIHGLHPIPDLMGLMPIVDSIIAYGIGPSASIVISLVTIALYGAVSGVMMVFAGSLLLTFVGWVFGGSARFIEVRSALAWSFAPYAWFIIVWTIFTLFNVSDIRQSSFSYGAVLPWEMTGMMAFLMVIDYIVRIVCVVWLIISLSTVLRISIFRTILVILFSLGPITIFLIINQAFGF
jgi:hypothetical protein